MSNNTQKLFRTPLDVHLPSQIVAIMIAVSLASCSGFSKKIKSSAKGHTDAKALQSEPTFHHGFGGDPDTFKLIDRMDTRELAALVKSEEVAKKIQKGPKPSLIYTGRALSLTECNIAPEGANHIAEIWSQDYLVNLFVAEGRGIKTAIESLEESDPKGEFRPFFPVHPRLSKRLGEGDTSNYWVLNGIRFRIADLSSAHVSVASDGGMERQPVPVMAQIKINYELNRYAAKTDPTIASASFIHSIAINDDYIGEFVSDVFNINQNPEKSGCDVLALLNKYVRSQGLRNDKKPRGSYFFLHTNIFDTSQGINEWRFTEHKLVSNDDVPFTAESYNQRRLEALRNIVATLIKPESSFNEGSFSSTRTFSDSTLVSEACRQVQNATGQACSSISVDSETAYLESKLPTGSEKFELQRRILGAHDVPVVSRYPEFALRIVPMQFPRFYVTENFDHLQPALDRAPLSIWFSGTLSDFGSNPGSRDLNYDLVSFTDGSTVGANHPVRRHEEAKTCAQCHASSHDIRFDPKSMLLGEIASMNFRHIGFGDGGNRRCNAFFGLVRPEFRASLSTFLLKTANGSAVNGYSTTDIRNVPAKMQPFGQFDGFSFAPETGIDVVRCFNVDGSEGAIKP